MGDGAASVTIGVVVGVLSWKSCIYRMLCTEQFRKLRSSNPLCIDLTPFESSMYGRPDGTQSESIQTDVQGLILATVFELDDCWTIEAVHQRLVRIFAHPG